MSEGSFFDRASDKFAMILQHCRGWLLTAVCFMAAIVLPQPARGVVLVDLALVLDGSIEPPGDEIRVKLHREPSDDIEIEVRAYVVSGENRERIEPVKAGRDANRDANGYFALQRAVQAPNDRGDVMEKLSIPYEDLDLPEGRHLIGYEVIVASKGEPTVARATPLSRVMVTKAGRMALHRRKESIREVKKAHSMKARFGSAEPKTTPGKVDVKDIEIVAHESVATVKLEPNATFIPRGFARSQVTEPPAAEGADPELDGLQGKPWLPAASVLPENERVVYFATNREPADANSTATSAAHFTARPSDSVSYGSCVVNFPILNHRRGKMELPAWWTPRDPKKHFLIQSLTPLTPDDFLQAARADDVLVFVHGFNSTFEYAVLRTAQLQYDVQFPGAALAFSWPSAGDLSKYQDDEGQVESAAIHLAEVLRRIVESLDPSTSTPSRRKVHVIAHSLGNRVLLNAIYFMRRDGHLASGSRPFGEIVLAAPDVGATMFNNLLPYAVDAARQVTYYYCNHDIALVESRRLNLYERVGLLPFFQRGLDTVNADGTDTSFIGHGYFASSGDVLLDIELMLKYGREPGERMPPLASHSLVFGHDHWAFREERKAEAVR